MRKIVHTPKTHSRSLFRGALHAQRERGISLFVVIVFVMLSMLLALWASRTALFNEMVVGNDADYQRAFEAAQTLLLDAELDIRGEKATGLACTLPSGANTSSDVCRLSAPWQIPLEAQEVSHLLALLQIEHTGCSNALCQKRTGEQDFWNNTNASQGITLEDMQAVGARYGQYTGAATGEGSNPILSETGSTRGGWYWIELLPYMDHASNSRLITNASASYVDLRMRPNVIYRITALAYGRKPHTMVVLQQSYARQKTKD